MLEDKQIDAELKEKNKQKELKQFLHIRTFDEIQSVLSERNP